MNKAVKRTLAILLAALMVLGVSTAAAAAPPPKQYESAAAPAAAQQAAPNWTMSITTQPTDTSFTMHMEDPNLAGMVISVSGGIFATPTSIVYNTVGNDEVQEQDKILWDFYVSPNADRWVVGSNAATLHVWANQCTDFNPLFTEGGIEYGYFDMELVFHGSVAITVVATQFDPGGIIRPLALTPVVMAFDRDVYNFEVFEFTAPQDGYYKFFSEGGRYGQILYSEAGDVLERKPVDPRAYLFDKNYDYLGDDDDSEGNYNFRIFQQLKANDVVYLDAFSYGNAPCSYTVKVIRAGAERPKLNLKKTEIKAVFHEYIDLEVLLEGTGLELWDVQINYDWEYFDFWWYYNPFGIKRGTGSITIEGPDGAIGTVKVKIDYSVAQWLCVIFLGGWAWLKYTGPGPFNLGNELGNLWDYGVFNSLRGLFKDWVYALYRKL